MATETIALTALPDITTVAQGDLIVIHDLDAVATKKVTADSLLTGASAVADATTITAKLDEILILDSTDSKLRRITEQNFLSRAPTPTR